LHASPTTNENRGRRSVPVTGTTSHPGSGSGWPPSCSEIAGAADPQAAAGNGEGSKIARGTTMGMGARRAAGRWSIVVPVLVAGFVAGCHARGAGVAPVRDLGGARLHAMHHQDLEESMWDLDYLRHTRIPAQLDPPPDTRRRFRAVAASAHALALSAERLPDVLLDLRLDAARQALYLRYASRLQRNALLLMRRADAGDRPGIDEALSRIGRACNACHATFRLDPLAPWSPVRPGAPNG